MGTPEKPYILIDTCEIARNCEFVGSFSFFTFYFYSIPSSPSPTFRLIANMLESEPAIHQTHSQPTSPGATTTTTTTTVPVTPKGYEYLPCLRDERFIGGFFCLLIAFLYMYNNYRHSGRILSLCYSIFAVLSLTMAIIPQFRHVYPQDELTPQNIFHRYVKNTSYSPTNTYIQLVLISCAFVFNVAALISSYNNIFAPIVVLQVVLGAFFGITAFSLFRATKSQIDFDTKIPSNTNNQQKSRFLLFDLRIYASIIAVVLGFICFLSYIRNRKAAAYTSLVDIIIGAGLFVITAIPKSRQVIYNTHTKTESLALSSKGWFRPFQLAYLWAAFALQFLTNTVIVVTIFLMEGNIWVSHMPELSCITFFRAIILTFLLVSLYENHNSVEGTGVEELLIKPANTPNSSTINHDIENAI
jgi:hypothetical protein